MSNNALQDILSKRFSRYTHATNPSVWEAIEMQLDAKKSNRAAIWFWILNGLAASFLIGMIVFPNQESLSLKFSSNLAVESVKKITPSADSDRTQTPSRTIAKTEQNAVKKDYIYFTNKINKNENDIDQNSVDLPAQNLPEFKPNISRNDASFIKPTLATRSIQKVNQFTTINKPFTQDFANPKKPFQSSVWLELQSSYLLGLRPPTESMATAFETESLPSLNRGFEFTLMSHFGIGRKFSFGVGIGYADASRHITGKTEAADYIELSTIDYNVQNWAFPIQANYALLTHRRIQLNAGFVLQPEFAQLTIQSNSEVITFASISGIQEITTNNDQKQQFNSMQLGIEPFAQVSLLLHPRFSANTSIGYRSYLKQLEIGDNRIESRDNFTFNIGIQYKLK